MIVDSKGRIIGLGDVVEWGQVAKPGRGRIIKITSKMHLHWDRKDRTHRNDPRTTITVGHVKDDYPYKIFRKTTLNPFRVVRVTEYPTPAADILG